MRFTSKVVENIAAEVEQLSNDTLGLQYFRGGDTSTTYVMKDSQRVYADQRSSQQAAAFLLGILESYETSGVELSEFSRNARLALFPNPHDEVIAARSAGKALGDKELNITREADSDVITCEMGTSAHGSDMPAAVRIKLEWTHLRDGKRDTHEIDVCDTCFKSKRREFGNPNKVINGRVTVLKTYGKP